MKLWTGFGMWGIHNSNHGIFVTCCKEWPARGCSRHMIAKSCGGGLMVTMAPGRRGGNLWPSRLACGWSDGSLSQRVSFSIQPLGRVSSAYIVLFFFRELIAAFHCKLHTAVQNSASQLTCPGMWLATSCWALLASRWRCQ
eukprot:934731-Pelagomonas_calceolata.AAC.1